MTSSHGKHFPVLEIIPASGILLRRCPGNTERLCGTGTPSPPRFLLPRDPNPSLRNKFLIAGHLLSSGLAISYSSHLIKGKRLLGKILQLLLNKPTAVHTASKSSLFTQLLPIFFTKFYNPAFLSLKSRPLPFLAEQIQNNREPWRGLALYKN